MARTAYKALTEREQIPTRVVDESSEASRTVAAEIARLIRSRAEADETAVLGLATGSTPVGVYNELVRMHREEGLSFRNVVTFNLDEYYPIEPEALQSYHRFMWHHLFHHVDIDPDNVHVPDGTLPIESVYDACDRYEQAIRDAGGIDLQLLGIGRTGHIGFNEPGSGKDSRTRLITLDWMTRRDAAEDFFGEENVPRRAITMGVGTILEARRVILMAFGEKKAPTVAELVEGPITPSVPATFLQNHPDAEAVLDRAAADGLTRFRCPWVLSVPIDWDTSLIRKAVIWLAQTLDKPVLKLTNQDYNERGLQDLLAQHGPAYDINRKVFRSMQSTITGWPGGKPDTAKHPDDPPRPGDATFPKRVLIFSPHPDDDVISMGGTLMRLVEQGHTVHIAYQVSGSVAVFDDDALRFVEFAHAFNRLFGIDETQTARLEQQLAPVLQSKSPGASDTDAVRQIKRLIRVGEAHAAGRHCGVPAENLTFLDMPFYETGGTGKKPLSEADIQLVSHLLERIRPHQIYAAGDLSDPHGTHRVCLSAILQATERVKDQPWFSETELWLYRGAWQEWEPEQIEMAVPLSPEELTRKRNAIFKHESQKDRALFPGSDPREFWQRAEERNRHTARTYDKLGLAEYEAIEAFVRWTGTMEVG